MLISGETHLEEGKIEGFEFLAESGYEVVATCLNSVDKFNEISLRDGDCCVSVCQVNIRSVTKNFDDFIILLEQIKFKYDILILCETWEVVNLDIFEIPGYVSYQSESKFNQNDGTIAYIREHVEHSVTLIEKQQVVFMKIACSVRSFNYDVFALYRPSSTDKNRFLDDLSDILQGELE